MVNFSFEELGQCFMTFITNKDVKYRNSSVENKDACHYNTFNLCLKFE